MGRFVKGEVVILPFPFSDLSDAKRRPALVIAPLAGDDLIVCQITSVTHTDNYAIPLATSDFASGSLPHPSVIRTNRLFTADSRLVIRAAGILSSAKLQEVIAKLVAVITN